MTGHLQEKFINKLYFDLKSILLLTISQMILYRISSSVFAVIVLASRVRKFLTRMLSNPPGESVPPAAFKQWW